MMCVCFIPTLADVLIPEICIFWTKPSGGTSNISVSNVLPGSGSAWICILFSKLNPDPHKINADPKHLGTTPDEVSSTKKISLKEMYVRTGIF
jgi:hypothetical protein